MGLAKTTNITFALTITEHVFSKDYANTTFTTEVFGEFKYIPPLTEFVITEEIIKDEVIEKVIEEIIPEEEVTEEVVEEIVEEVLEDVELEEPPEIKNLFKWTPPEPKKNNRNRQREELEIIVIPPLKVSGGQVNETGTLFVQFSKPIFTPAKYRDLDKRRGKSGFNDQFGQVIGMSVSSAYFDDEDPEIAISGFKLSAFNETGFSVDIQFTNPAFITQSLTEQDTLEITFKVANLFSDKIDYEKLDPGTSL